MLLVRVELYQQVFCFLFKNGLYFQLKFKQVQRMRKGSVATFAHLFATKKPLIGAFSY